MQVGCRAATHKFWQAGGAPPPRRTSVRKQVGTPPPRRTSGCKQVGRRGRGALVVACRWSATGRWWYSKCCVLETYSFQPSFLLSLPASLFLFLSFSLSYIYFDNLMPIYDPSSINDK